MSDQKLLLAEYKFDEERGHDFEDESQQKQQPLILPPTLSQLCCFILAIILFTIAGGVAEHLRSGQGDATAASSACHDPPLRKEWRTLGDGEKREYIRAVQCLRSTESKLGLNTSLYNDFPLVHSRKGEQSHLSAPFLSWHRYFLHLYESALRNDCGYQGSLVYWDWSLDADNLTEAPVWENTLGFGGNGNLSDKASVSEGYCVTDGPFANMEVPFVFVDSQPHCLSRGFSKEAIQKSSHKVKPGAIEALLQTTDYNAFNLGMENGPHAAIPAIVRGDFAHFTAPSDPVFFLHHTQLDRLWWIWQQKDLPRRHYEYAGQAAYQSNNSASLEDKMPMGGLAPDIPVSQLMSTESEILCYRY